MVRVKLAEPLVKRDRELLFHPKLKVEAKKVETEAEPAGAGCDLRRCEQCGNVVTDPMVARCPRCWSPLPRSSCGSCRGCPMGKAR